MVKLGVTPGGGGAAGVLLGFIAKNLKTEGLVSAIVGDGHGADMILLRIFIGRAFYEAQYP